MGDSEDQQLNPGIDGEPVYCNSCESPVVVYNAPKWGYMLVCSCPKTALDINSVASESNLFSPLSGRWSQVNDVDVKTAYD